MDNIAIMYPNLKGIAIDKIYGLNEMEIILYILGSSLFSSVNKFILSGIEMQRNIYGTIRYTGIVI